MDLYTLQAIIAVCLTICFGMFLVLMYLLSCYGPNDQDIDYEIEDEVKDE